MSTETLIQHMGLLPNPTSVGQRPWLRLWIQVCPGSCASKLMLLSPLWVLSFTLHGNLLTWSEIYHEHHIGLTKLVTNLFQSLLLTWLSIIFLISFAFRSTLAMDFTVTNSNLILTRVQKCGLRIGLDGKLSLPFPNILVVRMKIWMLFPWIWLYGLYPHSAFDVFFAGNIFLPSLDTFYLHGILGFKRLVVLCPTDLWKTLHLLWLAFSSLVGLSKIIIWYCNYIDGLCYIVFRGKQT